MRRRGKFYLDEEILRGGMAEDLFSFLGFVTYRVEMLAYNYKIECIGVCKFFEPLDDGLIVPEYVIEIDVDDDGNFECARAIAI